MGRGDHHIGTRKRIDTALLMADTGLALLDAMKRTAELERLLLTALALHGGTAFTDSEKEWRDSARAALGIKA